ncbi:MAG: cupin domain-containing protein [Mucilaginibacter sp.]|uniref:cupin domain-containing protein n=1 Tax=Mucilaginibacter sp. TaxID=1882438 RepID=UPI0031A71941
MENNFWLLGIHRNIIADCNDTNGQYDFIEGVAQPGSKTPPHIHHQYAETEYVIEGELSIITDTGTIVLKPGQGYTIPKGKPHALAATGQIPTKTITVFSPGGFAEVIKTVGIPGMLADGLPDKKTDMELFNALSGAIGDVTLSADTFKV